MVAERLDQIPMSKEDVAGLEAAGFGGKPYGKETGRANFRRGSKRITSASGRNPVWPSRRVR